MGETVVLGRCVCFWASARWGGGQGGREGSGGGSDLQLFLFDIDRVCPQAQDVGREGSNRDYVLCGVFLWGDGVCTLVKISSFLAALIPPVTDH